MQKTKPSSPIFLLSVFACVYVGLPPQLSHLKGVPS